MRCCTEEPLGFRQEVIQGSAGSYFMAGTTSADSLEGAQAAASMVHAHMILLHLARVLCLLSVGRRGYAYM